MGVFSKPYFTERSEKTGLTQAQTMLAYMLGSSGQTIVDNPITAYRQFVQQYAKDVAGKPVSPEVARAAANKVFRTSPLSACLSGLGPRIVGVGFKRIPKFTFFLGYAFLFGGGEVTMAAATAASIFSAPFINPIRMIEKQQRAEMRQTGKPKSVRSILAEARAAGYRPLFRGTTPLMGHSLASATTGLVGQPKLQRGIEKKLQESGFVSQPLFSTLVASAAVSPIYVLMTNPLSRLEVIMQTGAINNRRMTLGDAVRELGRDMRRYGMRGVFRGQGVGMAKAVISLSSFHYFRLKAQAWFNSEQS